MNITKNAIFNTIRKTYYCFFENSIFIKKKFIYDVLQYVDLAQKLKSPNN